MLLELLDYVLGLPMCVLLAGVVTFYAPDTLAARRQVRIAWVLVGLVMISMIAVGILISQNPELRRVASFQLAKLVPVYLAVHSIGAIIFAAWSADPRQRRRRYRAAAILFFGSFQAYGAHLFFPMIWSLFFRLLVIVLTVAAWFWLWDVPMLTRADRI